MEVTDAVIVIDALKSELSRITRQQKEHTLQSSGLKTQARPGHKEKVVKSCHEVTQHTKGKKNFILS